MTFFSTYRQYFCIFSGKWANLAMGRYDSTNLLVEFYEKIKYRYYLLKDSTIDSIF
jgi:hypothetical protein